MRVTGKVVVVTGGGNGIGAAMARRFSAEGARAIVVADIDRAAVMHMAQEIGGHGIVVDVAVEEDVAKLVRETIALFGKIDLFCSNAGVSLGLGIDTPNAGWDKAWSVNVMSQVYAARAVVPHMLERGEGYLLQTASAAGLLSISDPAYAVSKHGSVAFSEWLAITYGGSGIKVSCFCPMGVLTNMLLGSVNENDQTALLKTSVTAEAAADAVVKGLEDERFLILTHPEVHGYMHRKVSDYDRWLNGMRRSQQKSKAT